eukprot:7888518-Heterocapsa_arctica.AAC.1
MQKDAELPSVQSTLRHALEPEVPDGPAAHARDDRLDGADERRQEVDGSDDRYEAAHGLPPPEPDRDEDREE